MFRALTIAVAAAVLTACATASPPPPTGMTLLPGASASAFASDRIGVHRVAIEAAGCVASNSATRFMLDAGISGASP